MNELQIFNSVEFGQIRTVTIDGEPWFVASDIAKPLGYRMASDMTRRIDDEDRGTHLTRTPSGEQNMTVINESGLYDAILGSKIPSAKRFKRWVTSEVLPSIRKHGMYAVDELVNNPDLLISVATELKAEREKSRKLEKDVVDLSKTITELKPKANYVDTILNSRETVTTTQIAQDYGISARRLNSILADMQIQRKVNKQWILYAKYLDQGYVHSKTVDIVRANGAADVVMNTEWTQKGRLFLYEKLKTKNIYPLIEQREGA